MLRTDTLSAEYSFHWQQTYDLLQALHELDLRPLVATAKRYLSTRTPLLDTAISSSSTLALQATCVLFQYTAISPGVWPFRPAFTRTSFARPCTVVPTCIRTPGASVSPSAIIHMYRSCTLLGIFTDQLTTCGTDFSIRYTRKLAI